MLSSQKGKPIIPMQESIDSNEPCNVINSSSEFSENSDACKKQFHYEMQKDVSNNVRELEIIPIQDYKDSSTTQENSQEQIQEAKEQNVSVSCKSLSLKKDPCENQELLVDTYCCLKNCYNSLSKLKEITNEMHILKEESELMEDEKILKCHITVGILGEFAKSISLDKIDTTLINIDKVLNIKQDANGAIYQNINGITDTSLGSNLYKKYEKQIDKLKKENIKLVDRNKELEEAWKNASEIGSS